MSSSDNESNSSSTHDMSDDDNEVLIEAMEAVISDLHVEVKQLKQTNIDLSIRIETFKSMHNTDLRSKICDYL